MTTSRLRIGCALALTCVVMAGCGGSSTPDEKPADAAKLASAFTAATGTKLDRDAGFGTTVALRTDGIGGYERFGSFTIYVVSEKSDRAILLGDGEAKPGPDGLIQGSIGRSFKDYGHGILLSTRPDGDADSEMQQKRLEQALTAAVKHDPKLVPASERPCGPSPSGTCWLGGKRLIVAAAGAQLDTLALKVKVVSATGAARLPARNAYDQPERAKGRFVVVRYEVTNATNGPLNSLRPNLVIGEKTYTQDEASYSLEDDANRSFPLQPDETTTITTAFDLPEPAAGIALEQGQLEFPAAVSSGAFLSGEEAVGRLPLSGAAALRLRASRS